MIKKINTILLIHKYLKTKGSEGLTNVLSLSRYLPPVSYYIWKSPGALNRFKV